MFSTSTKLNLIIGNPVSHSYSPRLHNSLYKKYNIEDMFVFLASHVESIDLEPLLASIKPIGINALSVTIPHKQNIIEYLDDVDSTAMIIGSVNTVTNKNGIIKGYNTDWLGTILPIADKYGVVIDNVNSVPRFLESQKVAILGAGGVARAMAFACLQAGAEVWIFNRTIENAIILKDNLSDLLIFSKIKAFDMSHVDAIIGCDIVINSTSIGMQPFVDKSPVDISYIRKEQIVFDAVYTPDTTKLLSQSIEKGCKIIYGSEMFVYQAMYQFELHTGIRPTREDIIECMSKF